jgi:signal transduction histidine kinase
VAEAASTEPDDRLHSDADCLALVNGRVAEVANKLAHDMHQPLFALGGFLELLSSVASLDDDAREWIRRARSCHERLVSAVDDLTR